MSEYTTVKIRNQVLGEGRPTIAIPVTGKTVDEILTQAQAILDTKQDVLIEWRIDYFEGVTDENKLVDAGKQLRDKIGDLALLTTFRTKGEGGELALDDDQYFDICKTDALDLERFHDEANVKEAVAVAHDHNVVIVMSNHDFDKTPAKDELVSRLVSMKELGADVAKIAVMPNSVADVLTLLTATHEAHEKLKSPLITMSMGDLGKVSRGAGEVFGSSLTFGTVGAASAPGQVSLPDLQKAMETLKLS